MMLHDVVLCFNIYDDLFVSFYILLYSSLLSD